MFSGTNLKGVIANKTCGLFQMSKAISFHESLKAVRKAIVVRNGSQGCELSNKSFLVIFGEARLQSKNNLLRDEMPARSLHL